MSLTTFVPDVLAGSQTPRVSSVPPHSTTAGPDAVDYAASIGLDLDPWQALVLEGSLGEIGQMWAAFEVCTIVSRQNGKGGILEARELAGVELFGERLIVHTAHELKTAEEARLRMETICESSPDLDRQVKRVVRTNGKEAIEFKNGARIKYLARSKGSGRGFSGDLIVIDEAMFLSSESIAALLPTLSTAANPQIWYTASAGLNDSDHLRQVRERAMAGGDPSLAYFEWSAPEDADLDDPIAWAQANPAMGIRITDDFVRKERAALPDDDFARERLGIWSNPKRSAVIDIDHWATLGDPASKPVGDVAFAVDIPPERKSASISVAGLNQAGAMHVELIDKQSGTAWVAERLVELIGKWGGSVALDPGSPAGSLITDLENADVKPVLVGGREMAQACGSFYDAVVNGTLRHLNQPQLNTAIDAARKRTLGDAWAWHRRDTATDISPLVAATLAAHQAAKTPPKKRSGKAAFY